LVATAFAPVLFTLAFIRVTERRLWPLGVAYLAAAALLLVLCLMLMRAASAQLEILPFRVQSIKTADKEILAFVLAYLLPFASAGGQVNHLVLGFVLVVLFVIVWTTHTYHFNPLLGILGYHFYEVTAEGSVTFILITHRTLRDCQAISRVVQLTDYMVLDASR
jgi:hypothetical protein